MSILAILAALVICTTVATAAEEFPGFDSSTLTPEMFAAEPEVPHEEAVSARNPHAVSTPRHVLAAIPGAGGRLRGHIRVLNRTTRSGHVVIHGIDDTGERYGPVRLSMRPWRAKHLDSADLERGNPAKGLPVGLGNGTGWWRIEMTTTLPTRVHPYVRAPGGFIASIGDIAGELRTPDWRRLPYYRPPTVNSGTNNYIRSWLRIVNPHDRWVAVLVGGMDDTGHLSPPVTFQLLANEAVNLSMRQLEEGTGELPRWEGRMGRGKGRWEIVVIGSRTLQVMSFFSTPSRHLLNVSR